MSFPSLRCPAREPALGSNSFHKVAVAHESVRVVIHECVPWAVVRVGKGTLCHRHSDRVGTTLPQRTGGHLDTGCPELGMSGRFAA